jgi:flagellar protein FlaF
MINPMANPREFEAALLLEAALRLQGAQARAESSKGDIDEALLHNRQLWGIFLASIADADHPLPVEIRQTIANLGLFVTHETIAIASDPKPERLAALVGINRELAAGLLGRA